MATKQLNAFFTNMSTFQQEECHQAVEYIFLQLRQNKTWKASCRIYRYSTYRLISIYCNRVIRINQNTSSGITDNNLLHLQEGHEIVGQYLAYPIQRYPWTNLVKYRNQKERKKYLQYPYYNLCFHH